MSSFSAVIGKWAKAVPEAIEAVFKESAQDLVREMNEELTRMVYDQPETPNYARTGFLKASLVASTDAMPQLIRDNPVAPVDADNSTIVMVISGWEGDQTLYLGYTANYAAFVHFGARGAPPKQWVTLVSQRWAEIVRRNAAKVKQRFGL